MKEKKEPMIRTDKKKNHQGKQKASKHLTDQSRSAKTKEWKTFFSGGLGGPLLTEKAGERRGRVFALGICMAGSPVALAWDPLSHIYVHIECSQVLSLDSRSSLKGQQLNKTDILTEHLPACGGVWLWFLIDICPNRQTRVWDEKQTIGFPWLLLLECICSLNEMPGCLSWAVWLILMLWLRTSRFWHIWLMEDCTSLSQSRMDLLASWCQTLWTESVMATERTWFFTSASRWIIWVGERYVSK